MASRDSEFCNLGNNVLSLVSDHQCRRIKFRHSGRSPQHRISGEGLPLQFIRSCAILCIPSSTSSKLKKPSPQPSVLLVFTSEPKGSLSSIVVLSCYQRTSVLALRRRSFDSRSVDRGGFSTVC